jgi:anti-sigma B factor antagonist
MIVTVERDDTIKIIEINGQLDVAGSDAAREEILKLLDGKPTIISMAKCPYVASSGLRTLLIIAKTAKSQKIKLVYAAAIEEVVDVMQMTGFLKLLHLVPTIEDAVKELES